MDFAQGTIGRCEAIFESAAKLVCVLGGDAIVYVTRALNQGQGTLAQLLGLLLVAALIFVETTTLGDTTLIVTDRRTRLQNEQELRACFDVGAQLPSLWSAAECERAMITSIAAEHTRIGTEALCAG